MPLNGIVASGLFASPSPPHKRPTPPAGERLCIQREEVLPLRGQARSGTVDDGRNGLEGIDVWWCRLYGGSDFGQLRSKARQEGSLALNCLQGVRQHHRSQIIQGLQCDDTLLLVAT